MEILNLVIEWRPRKAALLLIAVLLCAVAGILMLVFPFGEGQVVAPEASSALYVLDCCVCVAISAQWVVGARPFRDTLKTPFAVFGDGIGGAEYEKALTTYSSCCYLFPGNAVARAVSGPAGRWHNRVREHCREGAAPRWWGSRMAAVSRREAEQGQRMFPSDAPEELYLSVCKGAFWLLWVALVALEAAALSGLAIPLVPKAYLILLTMLATLLNGVSYSLCCVYVWFLDALARIPSLADFPHNRHEPVLTPEYRRLSDAAKANTLMFLLVTLQFSAAILMDCLMLPGDAPVGRVQLACFLAVNVVGFVTFAVLFQCSRMSLGRVLGCWRDESVDEISREYRSEFVPESPGIVASAAQAAPYLEAYERVSRDGKMGRVDFLTIALAAASLLVNAATFALSLLRG